MRLPLRTLALPAISVLLFASTMIALQLRSDVSAAEDSRTTAGPSFQIDLADQEAAGMPAEAEGNADLDILEKSGSSSYRVPLRPASRSRATSGPAPSRAASPQRSSPPPKESPSRSDVPLNRLQDNPVVSAGFVLLGEPIGR